jgi:prepilin-type N-terminal cleavage/methylation domain-containing protein
MRRHRLKGVRIRGGFTLIEATMAMVILAVAASGIFMSFAAAASVQSEAHRRILASRLACDMVENIAAAPYAQIGANFPVGFSQTATEMGNTGDAYTHFSCVVVTNSPVVVSDGGQTVHLIQVTVAALYSGTEVTRVTTLVGGRTKN